MSEDLPLPASDEALLAAYVDGRLAPGERAALEARLEREPALAAALERQELGLAAIASAAGSVSAPLGLRSRVEAIGAERPGPRRRPRRGWGWLPGAALAAAAVAAVAIVVAFSGGPATEEVLAAATRPPVAAPRLDPSEPALLRDSVGGVRFPNYEARLGWEAQGVRTDEIGGRAATTVFYRREGRRIAYTIVAGEQLAWPPRADAVRREGTELRVFSGSGRTAVTWRRDGRTCLLSATNVALEALLDLAAWPAQGAAAGRLRPRPAPPWPAPGAAGS